MPISQTAYDLVDKLAGQVADMHEALQDPLFDSLAYGQHERMLAKLRGADFAASRQVFVGAHLRHARPAQPGRRYIALPENFLESPPTDIPAGSVFLLLNNDIGKDLARYIAFYEAHPQVLFVVWDWDSQHWIKMSALLAMHCDFYVSASSDNGFLLSHFNPHVLGPVFAGVHQWSRAFLLEHFHLLTAPRAETPFGPHVHYAKYPKRSRTVAALARHFDSVHFADNQYKAKTDEDNLKEWAAYKSHWIVPVLGGVPIRVYNALITGGIPILPSFYRNVPEVAGLGSTPLFYEVHDVLEPHALHAEANRRFESDGGGGLIDRVSTALATQHVDTRCERILQLLHDSVEGLLAGRAAQLPGHYTAH